MNKWISVVGLCLVANTMAYAVEPNGNVKLDDCPSINMCTKDCKLGYKTDERGCLLCEECKTEGVFESDIFVDYRSYDRVMRLYNKTSDNLIKTNRAGGADLNFQWPSVNGEVSIPYTFNSTIANGSQTYNKIMRAIKDYHNKTCIRFVRRTTERDYIEFTAVGGCQSHVGRVGGKQEVWIDADCSFGSSLHELMHALGFWHEHSRPDRDNYVTILWNNIVAGFKNNFDILAADEWNSYNSSYDLGSVMHYGGYFFSKQYGVLPTILNKATNQTTVGQRIGFSQQDLYQINKKYNCTAYLGNQGLAVQGSLPTTTIVSTTTPFVGPCIDNSTVCDLYQARGHCQITPYVRMTLCPKTCQYCKSDEEKSTTDAATTIATRVAGCVDNFSADLCYLHLLRGQCEANLRIKTHSCPKTCKYCTLESVTASNVDTPFVGPCVDNSTLCPLFNSYGDCSNSHVKTTLCRKTCQFCVEEQEAPKCMDEYRICPNFTEICKTDSRNICNKTCGLCGEQAANQPVCQDFSVQCPTTAAECKRKPQIMKRFCRKSCGYCVTSDQCGVPAISITKRVVGGTESVYKSKPWIAKIHDNKTRFTCGGSIISSRFIVTAAHCFEKTNYKLIDKYFAYLGKHHSAHDVVDKGQIKVEFLNGTIHPNYDTITNDNDIALVELRTEVTFNDYIKPICLPTFNADPVVDSYAVVSGWGDIDENYTFPIALQEAEVRIIDRAVCNDWFFKKHRDLNAVTDNMFCAGLKEGGKDACMRDSGGPLEQVVGGRHYLVGIVSWGYGCARKEEPGVYAQVSKQVQWINSIV